MIQTLQFVEATELPVSRLHEVPKLLVEWSSPWEEFCTSIRPALARSRTRLAGEAPYGLFPYRWMLPSWAIEVLFVLMVIFVHVKLAQMRAYIAPHLSSHDIIYYSGDELPRTADLGGSQAGMVGAAGGNQALHRTQTIRVARGGSLVEKVVDAPNLKLPASRDAVANLLAIHPDPGPPPLEGVRSVRPALTLPADAIAPPPNVTRDYTRRAQLATSVVPPAPTVTRDSSVTTPALSAAVIPPAPSVSRDPALVAPKLDSSVIAPAPTVAAEHGRTAPALNGAVIPPAPSASSPEISRAPVQVMAAVVPPPVSSPERESSRAAKLAMPAPSVIAPPPSADVSRDLHRLASGNVADPSAAVVPPPPAPSGSGGLMSSLLGKLFGTTDVVPPPPSATGGDSAGLRRAPAASAPASVVAPPPSVGGSAGGRSTSSLATNVVPPPPAISGSGGANGSGPRGSAGSQLATNVIPPPPSAGGGSSLSGSGGAKGSGLGGALDVGSAVAPPAGGGSGGGSGVVLSSQPGSKIGIPGNARAGSLAMSPSGTDKVGLGGGGGGASIGHGNGPGSGMAGSGPGAGKAGTDHGSDPNARGGISPTPGPGGAGSAVSGTPAVAGVAISGGNSAIINLPSFGSDGGGPSSTPIHSSLKKQPALAYTVKGTDRSGGAFARYGQLPGDNYSTSFDSEFGLVSLQFADPESGAHPYSGDLVGPQPIRDEVPAGLPRSQLVVRCLLDASGNLKISGLLEGGNSDVTVKVLEALRRWKFTPVTRAGRPIAVEAFLGFNVTTDDKF